MHCVLFSTYPTARVQPERITISQGSTVEVRCEATGSPPPLVKWTKLHSPDNANFEQIGPLLIIRNAQLSDRGVYVCVASNVHGLVQNSTIIEVTRLEAPTIQIHPNATQTIIAGGGAIIQCIATGIPEPTIRWLGPNSRPLSSHIEQLAGGYLR